MIKITQLRCTTEVDFGNHGKCLAGGIYLCRHSINKDNLLVQNEEGNWVNLTQLFIDWKYGGTVTIEGPRLAGNFYSIGHFYVRNKKALNAVSQLRYTTGRKSQ